VRKEMQITKGYIEFLNKSSFDDFEKAAIEYDLDILFQLLGL